MAVESKRGCGYRKVGGLYLVCDKPGVPCDRLPLIIERCPCCGAGLKFTRGWTWIDPVKLFEGDHGPGCSCALLGPCPACHPSKFFVGHEDPFENKAGLLWVGEKFYTVDEFLREAADLGISKRIKAIPRGFRAGSTWVFFAHMKGGIRASTDSENLFESAPAIFMAMRPRGFEKIVLQTTYDNYLKVKDCLDKDAGSYTMEEHKDYEEIAELVKANIKPVPVPDNDPDHNPKGANGEDD